MRAMVRLNWIVPEIRDNLYQRIGQFEGQSYVKDFVSTYEEAEKKIASYEDGLAILSDEDYFRLVKKRGNLEFYSII